MFGERAKQLKSRLKALGLSDDAIDAAWPTWWTVDAETSPSARAELGFSLSRKLGLDPRSLLEDGEPRFLWHDVARFKRLAGESETDKAAISSFGTAIGGILIRATPSYRPIRNTLASEFRQAIIQHHPFPRLVDLISICWSFGIPIIHLRVFPLSHNRMSAMTVRVGHRCAILIGKNLIYPPHVAFYLAHELAHIALGHLDNSKILVDFERVNLAEISTDFDEHYADRYALDLLTGRRDMKVSNRTHLATPIALDSLLQKSAKNLGIEPGVLALFLGESTKNWKTENGALRHIYSSRQPVWQKINRIVMDQLVLDDVPHDTLSYLKRVLGIGA